jgi:hypothetical protein
MTDWTKYQDIANARGTDPRYEEALARGDMRTASEWETYYYPIGGGWYSDGPYGPPAGTDPADNTHFEFRGDAPTAAPTVTPQTTPVAPSFDPKIDANTLYGKAMALFAGGYARIGAGPAPIVGPYINGDICDFVVSFGVPANPDGTRKLYNIWLDQELAWSSTTGGTLPADGTFASTPFDFVFKPGTLTQSAVSLESKMFPGDENAYRPMMILEIRNLPWKRFFDLTGKPIPYVAADIGDITDGAVAQDGINLGLALTRIALSPWVAMTSDDFETNDVTDVVGAILIKDNFSIIQLCQNITGEYRNLDLLVSDKVRVKDRGGNVEPDFIFDRDTTIGGDDALSVARANATSQRREHELFTIDPDQDYTAVSSLAKIPRDPVAISAAVGKDTATLPVVVNADTRQALATFALNYLENARRKISLKVPAFGHEIEPGDLFALRDIVTGFDNEVFKTTQTTHGANWTVALEGEAILRCSIFGDDLGDPFWDKVILLMGFDGPDGSTGAPGMLDESSVNRGLASPGLTAHIDTAQSVFGGSSVLFDGTSNYLSYAGTADVRFTTEPFTIECWIRPASSIGTHYIVSLWGPVGDLAWNLYQFNNAIVFHVSTTGADDIAVMSGGINRVNGWNAICAEFDGAKYRLYMDGVMVGSSITLRSIYPAHTPLLIGGTYLTGSLSFHGSIDELRISKGVARYGTDSGYAVATAKFSRG